MGIETRTFGFTKDGQEITKYILSNHRGMSAEVINYGGILTALKVPDGSGQVKDVVLGYDKPEQYFQNGSFYGSIVGPNANRIGKASFVLDNVTYELDQNDGKNNLHSHRELGYHKRLWKAEMSDNGVTFCLEDEDGNMGFPGNKQFSVSYSLDDANRLTIHYHAVSDRATVINPTNHTYFNLLGHASGNIEDHVVCLKAAHYTPLDSASIPTGEIVSVAGTPMDFTTPHPIGERIEDEFEQLQLAGGYDHNWVIDDWDGRLRQFAEVCAPGTDRVLKAYTDLPGVQFYVGNFIEREQGKDGALYNKRSGFCLETQFFPDSVNKPQFPDVVFGPDREYDSTTVYEFSYR